MKKSNKINKALRALAFALIVFPAGLLMSHRSAMSAPYPGGNLKDHGHTGPGDGGLIANFTASNKISVGGSTMTANNVVSSTGIFPTLTVTNAYIQKLLLPLTNALTFAYGTPNAITFGSPNQPYTMGVNTTTGSFVVAFGSDISDGTLASNQALQIGYDGYALAVLLHGTILGDAAPAGYVGEYVASVVGQTNAPATNTFGDLTSISLSAGDWDVAGFASADINNATWTQALLGISTTTGNSGSLLTLGQTLSQFQFGSSATTPVVMPLSIPAVRISIASTKTVYLKMKCIYSAGQAVYDGGRISARRVR